MSSKGADVALPHHQRNVPCLLADANPLFSNGQVHRDEWNEQLPGLGHREMGYGVLTNILAKADNLAFALEASWLTCAQDGNGEGIARVDLWGLRIRAEAA